MRHYIMAKTCFAALFLSLTCKLNMKVRVKHNKITFLIKLQPKAEIASQSTIVKLNSNDIIKLRETCIAHLCFYHAKVPANSTSKFDISKLFLENLENKRFCLRKLWFNELHTITVKGLFLSAPYKFEQSTPETQLHASG